MPPAAQGASIKEKGMRRGLQMSFIKGENQKLFSELLNKTGATSMDSGLHMSVATMTANSKYRTRKLTQILMLGPVAAHSQYRLGLKHRALMVSPAPSRVYRCLPSFKSQSIA